MNNINQNNMDTKRSLYEIEVALAKHDKFNYLKNIVVFNVIGISKFLNIYHECDMLVLSQSCYLTEIEVKRSWTDFMADFDKKHKHDNGGIIKHFYYCVPESIYAKCRDKLYSEQVKYSGIITYNEDLIIKIHGHGDYLNPIQEMHPYRKLFLEEQLYLARLGAMRVIKLKEKIINYG